MPLGAHPGMDIDARNGGDTLHSVLALCPASILGSILSGRWGLCGGSTSLMMLGPARMAYIAFSTRSRASACYSLILVLARVGWRGGPGRVRIRRVGCSVRTYVPAPSLDGRRGRIRGWPAPLCRRCVKGGLHPGSGRSSLRCSSLGATLLDGSRSSVLGRDLLDGVLPICRPFTSSG